MDERPLKILLVEDNLADARLFEVLLLDRHAIETRVTHAPTLAAALAALEEDAPGGRAFDLALLDLGLPDSESLETLRAVTAAAPRLAIVVLSGLADERIALQAVREGAQDYLVKGRTEADLLARTVRHAVERKRAQDAAIESRRHLELALKGGDLGSWDWNIVTGDFVVNERWAQMLGYEPGELEPNVRTRERLLHPDDAPTVMAVLRQHLVGRTPIYETEHRLRAKSGAWVWVLDRGKVLERAADGAPLRAAGTHLDITDRKAAEAALRETTDMLSAIVDNAPLAVITVDENAVVRRWNPAAEAMFGWRREEILGRPLPIVPPEDQPRFRTMLNDSMHGRSVAGAELRRRRKDGTDIDVELWTASLRGADGRIVATMGLFADITARKTAERNLKQSEEHLRQSQKMEAVGMLASGVAHDFNNLLTAIRGYASLARSSLGDNHPALESLEQVEEASRQATGVASALLTFARKARTEKAPTCLAPTVETAARLFRRTLPPSIGLVVETSRAQALWVLADSTQLQQVVMNLGLNARDAITGGGTITISVERGTAAGNGSARSVLIRVRDTGAGIPDDIRARIFEPFFTTKPRGRGTGLGLAVIHGIVQDHAGTIEVESAPGRGSTFTVSLPLIDAPAAADSRPGLSDADAGAGGVALLAEHNQLVRGLLASMLSSLGYDVIHAATSAEAMQLASAGERGIDLVVIDQHLPEQGAAEVLKQLRERVARAIVVASADPASPPLDLAGVVMLRKPFQVGDLRRAIQTLSEPEGVEKKA